MTESSTQSPAEQARHERIRQTFATMSRSLSIMLAWSAVFACTPQKRIVTIWTICVRVAGGGR
jgi:hypothetical protein